jgi:hypothetical protein
VHVAKALVRYDAALIVDLVVAYVNLTAFDEELKLTSTTRRKVLDLFSKNFVE